MSITNAPSKSLPLLIKVSAIHLDELIKEKISKVIASDCKDDEVYEKYRLCIGTTWAQAINLFDPSLAIPGVLLLPPEG